MSQPGTHQITHQESRGMTAWVHHHQLVTFFVLTYVFTWGFQLVPVKVPLQSIFQILGTFGPTLSAVILTAIQSGRTGVRDLLARVFRWRSGFRWYLLVLLMPFVLMMCAIGVALLAGWSTLGPVQPGQLAFLPLIFLLGGLFYGPFGEEPGWRGYALPRLLQRRGLLTSGLLLGVIWGLWHLPLFFLPDTNHHQVMLSLPVPPLLVVASFLMVTIALSLIFAWVFHQTHGSVLMALLLHTSVNTALIDLPLLLKLSHYEPVILLYMGIFVPCALLLLLRFWPTQVARV